MRVPSSAIASAAASGETRQIHAPTVKQPSAALAGVPPVGVVRSDGETGRVPCRGPSAAQLRHAIDVEREPSARHRDHEAEPDDDLGGGDRHHREREDLAVPPPVVAREADQGQVAAVEHDLEREQDDDRVAAEQHADGADREQERGDREVPGHGRAEHQTCAPGSSLRECAPRMTPPIAATSRTIDVISNARRWSVRKRRPICAGLPNERLISAAVASRPPAFSPITTMISTRIAAAARTAPTAYHVGPPSHTCSSRGPTYAMTNRNMTITAPA